MELRKIIYNFFKNLLEERKKLWEKNSTLLRNRKSNLPLNCYPRELKNKNFKMAYELHKEVKYALLDGNDYDDNKENQFFREKEPSNVLRILYLAAGNSDIFQYSTLGYKPPVC